MNRMPTFEQFWHHALLGNSIRQWTFAALAFVVTFTVLPLARGFVLGRQRRWMGTRAPVGLELALLLIRRTSRLFLWTVALYVAERFLDLPPRLEKISTIVIVVVAWLQVGLWATAALRFALERRGLPRGGGTADREISGSLDVILFVAQLVIFTIVLLLALGNLGVDVTALIAGLGIGGIAIALAVQSVLGDLLASLSITMDRPFAVGDWLRIDDCEGTVERIGVKSTRIRSVSGEQIILSNADVLTSRVRNLGRMSQRRALFTLGVAYETAPDRLAQIPHWIRAEVERVAGTRFEHCMFRSFGESALNFEVCYFVPDPQPRSYLQIVDAVNRGIHAAFAREGIVFAYPTRTVHMHTR
jgi:small-conductance mechanosensitive channel